MMKNFSSLSPFDLEMTMRVIGDPCGAASVVSKLLELGAHIDPDHFAKEMGPVCLLSELHIVGPRVSKLFWNVCSGSAASTVAVLRAVQLRLIDREALDAAIDGTNPCFEVSRLERLVKEQLPRFNIYID